MSDKQLAAIRAKPKSLFVFFFSSRRRHTRFDCDWRDVCSSDLDPADDETGAGAERLAHEGVLAGGAWLARGELGEAERAEEREPGAQHPNHEGEPRAEIGRASCRERV